LHFAERVGADFLCRGNVYKKPFAVADKGWGLVGHARLSETKALNCFRSLQNLVRFNDPLSHVKESLLELWGRNGGNGGT